MIHILKIRERGESLSVSRVHCLGEGTLGKCGVHDPFLNAILQYISLRLSIHK